MYSYFNNNFSLNPYCNVPFLCGPTSYCCAKPWRAWTERVFSPPCTSNHNIDLNGWLLSPGTSMLQSLFAHLHIKFSFTSNQTLSSFSAAPSTACYALHSQYGFSYKPFTHKIPCQKSYPKNHFPLSFQIFPPDQRELSCLSAWTIMEIFFIVLLFLYLYSSHM